MHPDPNTASIFVFFVLSFWGLVLAAGQQRFLSPTDQPISVVSLKSHVPAGSSDIKSCLSSASPRPSFRVRFQKLKMKTANFTRTLQNSGIISTYASEMKSVNVNNIVNCAEVAEAKGFVGFSFNGGLCDMFKIVFQPCGCETGAQDVFYVQASFWDKKESALPQIFYHDSYSIAKFRLTSSVYDKMHLFVGRAYQSKPENATSLEELSRRGCATSEVQSCHCMGSKCFSTNFVDIQHCVQKSCDAPGSTTILQVLSAGPRVFKQYFPFMDILSECGKTILLDLSPITMFYRPFRIMSHQGYGCQWYPKTGTDHECVVTFTTGNRSLSYSFNKFDMVVDGNSTTCEGDSLSIHNGAPTNSTLLTRWNACTSSVIEKPSSGDASNLTFVFKRTARQYQADGFNWGFTIGILFTLGP